MTLDQIFVLILLGGVFLSFFKEYYPPEVTALGASAALLATGILETQEGAGLAHRERVVRHEAANRIW